MLDKLKRKFSYLSLMITFLYAYSSAYLFSLIFRNRKNKKDTEIKKIAAVWYNPPDLTGSNLRMGHWKEFFEKEGFQYDNFYVSSIKEFHRQFENGSWSDKYNFYRVNLLRRLKQFYQLKDYDVVWIDRGFVIAYPLKSAFFEKCIKRMVGYLVVDSTDGQDYDLNPELVLDTMRLADRVTVGFDSLKELFSEHIEDIVQFNWTIPDDNYLVKKEFELNDLPVIGWMGSPGNFVHVKAIEKQLQEVAKQVPFRFVYICREEQEINIPDAVIEHHEYGDDYFKIIAGFDIGIAPCFGDTIIHKGKIGMKHQEFLICATPQVCSPVAISEFVEDRKDVLIAREIKNWKPQLLEMLNDKELRREIGENARSLFQKHYTYESEFPKVKEALTRF